MRLATTTADLARYVDGCSKDLGQTKKMLDCFAQTQFKYLDYSFFNDLTAEHLLLQDNWRDSFKEIRDHGLSLGLKFVQAHSAGGNPIVQDAKYDVLLLSTIRSIEACGILGIKNIVVHAGQVPGLSQQETFAQNLDFYQKLFPVMEKFNINVLVENRNKTNMPEDFFILDTGAKLCQFLAYVNHPLLGACWDTGHANIMLDEQYEHIVTMGKNLKAVHIADNLGNKDHHFAPFFGTTNWDEVMCALLDSNYQGYFTLECDRYMIQSSRGPEPRKKWSKEDRLYEVPLSLKMEAMKLLYKIGEHMLAEYDCLEA